MLCLIARSMLSPDGMCKSFDAAANGYARAEGIACVVIKRHMEGAQHTPLCVASLSRARVGCDAWCKGQQVGHAEFASTRRLLPE